MGIFKWLQKSCLRQAGWNQLVVALEEQTFSQISLKNWVMKMWEILLSNSLWFIPCVSGEFREITSFLPLDFASQQVKIHFKHFSTLAYIL